MRYVGFREAARFVALGVFLATSVNLWVWAKVSPRSQRWGYIGAALVSMAAIAITLLDIIIDP